MGRARYIYFTKDIDDMLEEIENVSKFIQDLVREHFKENKLSKLPLEKLKKLEELSKIQEDIDKQEKEILYGTKE